MGDASNRENNPMRSLDRALQILAILEDSRTSTGVTDLSRASKLPKATVLRILSILGKYGYIEKMQGRYRLGAAVLPLAHAYVLGNELLQIARPVLQELAQVTKETASLFVRLGFKRLLVERVEGLHPLRFVLPIGEKLPLHVGVGKVLAAAMSEEDLLRMFDELGEMRLVAGELVARETFLAELERIRRQGYFISFGERMLGMVAVAAPVVSADGSTIAAVSLAGAKDRMSSEELEWVSIVVRDAARTISERYGGTPAG